MAWAPDIFSLLAAFCFGVVLPWSQRADAGTPDVLRRLAWAGAPFLLLASGYERGPWAAVYALPALVYAVWLAAFGLARFTADDTVPLSRRLMPALAATGPMVAAVAWVWSRLNGSFAGFPEPLATLTTVHFSITFGVLPLAMGAWEQYLSPSRLRAAGVFLYALAAPATALCFALRRQAFVPTFIEVVCAALFCVAFLLWYFGLPAGLVRRVALLLVPGFLLGAGYTAATHFGWQYLTIPQMAGIHGFINLLGSAMLAGLAPRMDSTARPPAPDLAVPAHEPEPERALFTDRRRVILGDWSEESFARVSDALLGYRFYPSSVMMRRTQFEDEHRPPRVGDRLGLGLLMPNLKGLPRIQLPAIVEVVAAERKPESARFGYRTTNRHYGRGLWVAEVRREDDRLVLEVSSHVRPCRWFVWLGLPVYRWFQVRAFLAGAENLRRVA
jgi:uncharacterized protein (UPF0548 family)